MANPIIADQHHSSTDASAPATTPPDDASLAAASDADEPLWEPLAVLLEDPDDPFVSAKLPELLRIYPTAPAATIVEYPQVLARLCAMRDVPFIAAILTLAQPDHGGQPVLFLQPVMERIAALAYHQYQGAFLRVVRTWPGFDARAYDRYELRPYRLRHSAQQALHAAHAVLINGGEIQEEAIDWFWYPYIAKKTITILDGDPGVGKTMFACQLAACASRGYALPDQAGHVPEPRGTPGEVLMVAMEDHLGSVVRTRLRLCDADMDKLTFVNEIVDADGLPRPFTLADLPLLQAYMEEKRPTLVYIDSIQSVLGGKADIGSPNQMKALLLPLERLAQDYNCAIVCSRHPAKPGQNVARLIHRGMGSQSIIGSARSGLFIEEYPGDKTHSLLVHYKTNSGALGRTQLFSKAQGQFQWAGVSRITDTMLAGSGRGPDPHAFLAACFWLEDFLPEGRAVLATKVEEAATDADLCLKTLKGAKKALGVVSSKTAELWYWYLSPLADTTMSTSDTLPTLPTTATLPSSGGDWGKPLSPPLDDGPPPAAPPPLLEDQVGEEDQEGKVDTVMDEDSGEAEQTPVAAVTMTPFSDAGTPAGTAQRDHTPSLTRTNGHTNGHSNGHSTGRIPLEAPPQFCPGCAAQTCWLDRGTYYQCAHRTCGRKVLKAGEGR